VDRKAIERERMEAWLGERIAASQKRPVAEVVALTPMLAALLLERNPINRKIAQSNNGALTSDILGGRFLFNGEAIVISKSGLLLDGQHRCNAVLETGQTITVVLVFGPEDEARFTIDIGRPKTVADFLHIKGRKHSSHVGTIARHIFMWKKLGRLAYGGLGAMVTKAEILNAADTYKGIERSVSAAFITGYRQVGTVSILGFCHWAIAKRAGYEAADWFITKLIEGDGLSKADPIYVARKKLIGMGRGDTANARANVIFKAWNAYRRGETPKLFYAKDDALPKLEG
jgi:hypothetical protein